MARDPAKDPRTAPQTEEIPLDPELAAMAKHYRDVRRGQIMKSIATAHDVRLGRDPTTGLASLFPDYGPLPALSPAERASTAASLARTRTATIQRPTPRTAVEAKRQFQELDDSMMQLAKAQLSATASTEAATAGQYLAQYESSGKKIDALRGQIPTLATIPSQIRTQTDEIAQGVRAGRDLGQFNDKFVDLGNYLTNLEPLDIDAAIRLVSKETGVPVGELTRSLTAANQGNPAFQAAMDLRASELGKIQNQIGTELAAQKGALKELNKVGAWSHASKIMKEYFDLKEEGLRLIEEGAEPGSPELMKVYRQLAFLEGDMKTSVGVATKEAGVAPPPEDPGRKATGEDIDKAWKLLEEPDSRDAMQRLYDDTVESDQFKAWKRARGYTDDRFAFDQLMKESRTYERQAKQAHRATRRANVITGAAPATPGQENVARTIDAAKGGQDYGEFVKDRERTAKRDEILEGLREEVGEKGGAPPPDLAPSEEPVIEVPEAEEVAPVAGVEGVPELAGVPELEAGVVPRAGEVPPYDEDVDAFGESTLSRFGEDGNYASVFNKELLSSRYV